RDIGGKPAGEAGLCARINEVFKQAARDNNYKHAIFNVSYLRGGSERYGGIFWEDLSALFEQHEAVPFRQIVGHTAMPQVSHSADGKIIAVDVGMNKVFDGQFEYLKIKGRNIEIIRVE
ncbi:MAG: hypothetical protein LBR90_00840, partial [Elusimicrobiota bacterium]|nr:hypothetical protein [Elusimicrobiota bacterium]